MRLDTEMKKKRGLTVRCPGVFDKSVDGSRCRSALIVVLNGASQRHQLTVEVSGCCGFRLCESDLNDYAAASQIALG